ncbi:MAG TPA: hypothetical protein VF245_11510 [Solirubrobacterales bacterium]
MMRNVHLAVMAVGWVGFFALLAYSGTNDSWSSSYSTGVLTSYLVMVMAIDETIDRLARRVARRRRLHR